MRGTGGVLWRAWWGLCLGAVALSGLVGAADWPQWRGPARDGVSQETGWFVTWPPKQVWTAELGEGYSSVSVVGERAYAIGHTRGEGEYGLDSVYCLDARTGEPIWKHKYKCLSVKKDRTGEYPGPRASPLVEGDVVYTVSLEGHLFCLDAKEGKVRWYQNLEKYALENSPLMYGYCASPMTHGETLLCYLNGACMAFDKTSGKPLWRRQGGAGPWNVPSPIAIAVDGQAQVVIGETALVGVDVSTGKMAWEYNLGRSATMTPLVIGDRVFFSTYPNKGHCGLLKVGAGEPKLLWQNRTMQVYHVGNPVLWNGHLYGIDSARTEFAYSDRRVSSLKCLDLATGEVKWKERNVGWAQLIVADGKLIILREEGDLVVAEASPGAYKELGRAKIFDGPTWALPVLADGRLYCRNSAGTTVCLQVGAE